MAERTQKQKPAPSRTEETVEEAPAAGEAGREAQGRARRPARRDRRSPRIERRGLREVLCAKGWRVAAGRLSAAMSMPFFTPGDDPGPSFPALLERVGLGPQPSRGGNESISTVPHATTCVAVRYADGVVMAGDRRATSGNLISHRTMEKVAEADRHSAVSPSPAPPARPWRWSSCSSSSWSTTRRSRARRSAWTARRISCRCWCAATSPPPCRAWSSCRSSPATTCAASAAGCSPTTSPADATRSASTSPPGRAACTPAP